MRIDDTHAECGSRECSRHAPAESIRRRTFLAQGGPLTVAAALAARAVGGEPTAPAPSGTTTHAGGWDWGTLQ